MKIQRVKDCTIGVLLILVASTHIVCTKNQSTNPAQGVAEIIAQARNGEVVGVNEHQLKTIIASFKGKKVVLVNFWATWCIPCVEEFPDLVKLYQTYQSRGLEVIAISADRPAFVEGKIKPFLKKNEAKFLCFVKDTRDDGAFIDAIDKEWGGEIPVTFIYDRSGQRAESFYGKQDWETFVAAVEPSLNREN